MADGLIPDGVVDERDIRDVQTADLAGFEQCHFFAGIGGWAYALQLAGWDGPVWTGSCPCQPFSSAGKGQGFEDPRHLWPTWFRLIRECRPPVVFGEQVASQAGLGWLDLVSTDVEAVDYAFGAADIPAAGVRAPHRRQRLMWVAHAREARSARGALSGGPGRSEGAPEGSRGERRECEPSRDGATGGLVYAAGKGRPGRGVGPEASRHGGPGAEQAGEAGPWSDLLWLPCRDGKARPVEPGTFPLVNGASGRVGRLRAYGNAINAEAATQFIAAYLETKTA